MTDIKEFGGPAFPATNHHGHKLTGMTLRDYFAAKAMQGFLSSLEEPFSPEEFERLAEIFYSMADKMLKARGEI